MADRHIDFSALNAYQDNRVQIERFLESQNFGLLRFLEAETQDNPILRGNTALKNKLATLIGRTVQIPAIKKKQVTVVSSESFTIPANLSETAMRTITFVSIFGGFWIYPQAYHENLLAYNEDFRTNVEELSIAMANSKESTVATLLNTRKTQIWAGSDKLGAGYNFNTVDDNMEVTNDAQKDMMFGKLASSFRKNKLAGGHRIVSSVLGMDIALDAMAKYSRANEKYLDNPRNRIPRIFESHNLDASDLQFLAYMVKNGSIGEVVNHKPDFVQKTKSDDGWKWDITDQPFPHLNKKVDVLYRKIAADASGVMDNTAQLLTTTVEQWGFLHRYCLVSNYNSSLTTQANDILKVKGFQA